MYIILKYKGEAYIGDVIKRLGREVLTLAALDDLGLSRKCHIASRHDEFFCVCYGRVEIFDFFLYSVGDWSHLTLGCFNPYW